jgi:predicted transcriptional regulator
MDREKLKKVIAEKGLMHKAVAEKLGISPYGFALKLNGTTDFKVSEMNRVCEVLSLTSEERNRIFFGVDSELNSH